jgi:hypothetical protein
MCRLVALESQIRYANAVLKQTTLSLALLLLGGALFAQEQEEPSQDEIKATQLSLLKYTPPVPDEAYAKVVPAYVDRKGTLTEKGEAALDLSRLPSGNADAEKTKSVLYIVHSFLLSELDKIWIEMLQEAGYIVRVVCDSSPRSPTEEATEILRELPLLGSSRNANPSEFDIVFFGTRYLIDRLKHGFDKPEADLLKQSLQLNKVIALQVRTQQGCTEEFVENLSTGNRDFLDKYAKKSHTIYPRDLGFVKLGKNNIIFYSNSDPETRRYSEAHNRIFFQEKLGPALAEATSRR